MGLSRSGRFVLVIFLLAALFALLVVGGIDRPPAPELGDYPDGDQIASQSEEYRGEQVMFWSHVVATDPLEVKTFYETDRGVETLRLRITGVDSTVTAGDRLQIFGVLTGPRTVRTTNIVVHPRRGIWYSLGISFLAGLWVLGRIVVHWRVDVGTGALVPRSKSLKILDRRDK